MEAWKFIDYSSLSPVYALGFTAEQWGLEPFPGSVVATTGYWQDIEGTNNALLVWPVPYSCLESDGSYLDYYSTNIGSVSGLGDISNNLYSFGSGNNICEETQPCGGSGCTFLIEGILKTTTGPANSDIVGLTHGITCFIIIAIAIAIATSFIMGSCFSNILNASPPPPPSREELSQNLRSHINPPPRRVQTYAERAASEASTAREVARCSGLLRQMYALDLHIWGMEDCIADEIPKREELMRRANMLFAEINRIVHAWRSGADEAWSADARLQIREICVLLDRHDLRRYET